VTKYLSTVKRIKLDVILHTYETLKKHCNINDKEDKYERHLGTIVHPVVPNAGLPGLGCRVRSGSTHGERKDERKV
jgi:hypothetical protein